MSKPCGRHLSLCFDKIYADPEWRRDQWEILVQFFRNHGHNGPVSDMEITEWKGKPAFRVRCLDPECLK